MTTTSVFQGIYDGAKISSRVNHPPGGAAKIHDEAKREPKTVRVLKPPGGESSISFTDDSSQRRQPVGNGAASSPPPEDCGSPSGAAEAYTFEAVAAAASPMTSAEGKDASAKDVSEASDTKEVSSRSDSSNGTTPKELSPESTSEPSSPLPDPPKQNPSDVGPGSEGSSEVVSCHGGENGSSVVASHGYESNGRDASEVRSEKCFSNVVATTAVQECEATAITSSESHQTSTEISTVEERVTIQSNDNTNKVVVHTQQNGSSLAKAKASSPDPSPRPAGATPTPTPTSTPTSTPKPSEDTTDRMFGRPTSTTPKTPQPRKIKDHMRSNIFMSDEDYTPTRSSRMNAAVITDTSPNVPAAGQRQRIPPGGFSTKLW